MHEPDFGPPGLPMPPAPRPSRVPVVGAWLLILVICAGAIALNVVGTRALASQGEDTIGLAITKVMARYLIGAAQAIEDGGAALFGQARELEAGTVDQRQRFVVLASELAGPASAHEALVRLEEDLADPPVGTVTLTPEQERVQALLHELYPHPVVDETGAPVDRRAELADALAPDDRAFLEDRLDWFGRLGLLPVGTIASAEREALIDGAKRFCIALISLFGIGLVIGSLGFVGLVVLLVLASLGKARSRLGPSRIPGGIYAETFAVWLILFVGAQQTVVAMVATVAPDFALLAILGVFAVSLLALAWPVVRGYRWADVRHDIGWSFGSAPLVEPLVGAGGYAMALPILGLGVLGTLLLIAIQALMTEAPPTFAPAGGPAHPVVAEMLGPNIWIKVQILLLASVAAPIVEETMFRGVLYRHLREATRGFGVTLSIVASAAVSSLLFAAIHPQGWVAIPVLMSLAVAFVILREWRGTLIPSMMVHGISNGIVMLTVMLLFGG